MESRLENNVLTIYLVGRIDSSNANDVETDINYILNNNSFNELVLDAKGLEYISSAGLRIILRLKKDYPTISIINVTNEVYDIFEMTGFSEMIKIVKAYRNLSIKGCEIIGRGANGEVYRLDPDTIIKVYKNPDSLDEIHRERELARSAFVLGIPTAIPYDVVRVDDTYYGSVFELLNAKSFAKLLVDDSFNKDDVIKMYVDLLKKIHSTNVNVKDFPNMKKVALDWVDYLKDYLPKDKYEKLHKMVNDVKEVTTMMHGDYHVKNVMLQNNEVLLIDMDTLCYGNKVFEFGSIYNAYIGYGLCDRESSSKFIGLPFETAEKVWKDTLRLYFDCKDENKFKELEDKAALMGLTRVLRRVIRRKEQYKPGDLELYKEKLIELIDKVDNLIME